MKPSRERTCLAWPRRTQTFAQTPGSYRSLRGLPAGDRSTGRRRTARGRCAARDRKSRPKGERSLRLLLCLFFLRTAGSVTTYSLVAGRVVGALPAGCRCPRRRGQSLRELARERAEHPAVECLREPARVWDPRRPLLHIPKPGRARDVKLQQRSLPGVLL
jgi:hypothetical protein